MMNEPTDATRVMAAPPAGAMDRTMVAGSAMPAAPPAGATQMGVTTTCAVCRTINPGLETYCSECGFLLSSMPGASEPAATPSGPQFELIETASGRKFPLQNGVNYVGREMGDILLIDGTVSRRHAQITVENGSVIVMDGGSTNGTQVDGIRLNANVPTPAKPGSIIRFGNVSLSLNAPGGTAEATIVASAGAAPASAPAFEATAQIDLSAAPPMDTSEPSAGEAEPAASSLLAGGASATPAPAVPSPAPPAAEQDAQPTLAVLAPVNGGEPIQLTLGTVSIGRRPGNTVVITGDPYVSGKHAELRTDHFGCHITDLGSTNGTVVNGTRLEPGTSQLLLDGDEVNIGQTAYRYGTVAEPAAEAETESSHAANGDDE
jgi:pSer/pThr/pTyr-binding forkhead associated (FHA) protein